MKALSFLALLAIACGAPSTPARSRPARATPELAPACPSPSDPAGWFAMGSPAPPATSAVFAHRALFAIDDGGAAWVAVANDGHVAIARASSDALAFEEVPGVAAPIALGVQGTEPVLVAIARDARGRSSIMVMTRHGGAWSSREAPALCESIPAVDGAAWSEPSVAVDRSGAVWQGCIEGIRGPFVPRPAGPQLPEQWWDDHPIVATRLHVGRLEGARWAELAPTNTAKTNRTVSLVVDEDGGIEAHIDWPRRGGASRPAFVIDPSHRVLVRSAARGERSAEELAGSVVRRGSRKVGVVRADACSPQGGAAIGACVMTLGASDGSEPWRPLVGAWALGISGTAPALAPAIALDDCGAPVVAWNDGAGEMELRRWSGATFVALPSLRGEGPHGLAVGADGTVFVGAWQPRDVWTLSVLRGNAVETEPPLRASQAGEWSTRVAARTQLDVRHGIRVEFPRDYVAGDRARLAFSLEGNDWRENRELETAAAEPAPPFDDVRPVVSSALARDPRGQLVAAWSASGRIHVAAFDGAHWNLIDDAGLPPTFAIGAPAVAASAARVCVAWSSVGPTPSVFVRCHRLVAP